MITKRDYYEAMATRLVPLWTRDALMMTQDPDRWRDVRDLDDALVRDWEDETVPIGAYRLKCLELEALYTTWTPTVAPLGARL
jgi:hypothetical protein